MQGDEAKPQSLVRRGEVLALVFINRRLRYGMNEIRWTLLRFRAKKQRMRLDNVNKNEIDKSGSIGLRFCHMYEKKGINVMINLYKSEKLLVKRKYK